MKIFALVSLLVAGNIWSARAADVKRFELNGQDTLTIVVPRAIRVRLAPGESGAPHLILSDTNKVCEMHVVLAKNDGKLSDDQIKDRLLTAGQRLLPDVVEKEIKVQKLGGSSFTYFYFDLTDEPDGSGAGWPVDCPGIGPRHRVRVRVCHVDESEERGRESPDLERPPFD